MIVNKTYFQSRNCEEKGVLSFSLVQILTIDLLILASLSSKVKKHKKDKEKKQWE